jgi:hypothetical protein
MRNKVFIIVAIFTLVICLVGIAGCSRDDDDVNKIRAEVGAFVNIPNGETALISAEKLYIKFDSVISDSRCPTGVTCIWAGEATAKVQMKLNGQISEIVLTDNGGKDGMSQTTFNTYKLTFQIKPYPVAGVTPTSSDYVLSIKIDK